MKSYANIILSLCFITLFCACEKHYELITEINPDGSCIRQCRIVTRDSAFLTGDTTSNPFPFSLSSGWQLTVYDSVQMTTHPWPLSQWTPTDQNPKQVVTASRYFPSAEALNDSFRFNHSPWQDIIPEVTLKKSFRWFYTYYNYQEKYPQFPAEKIPIPLNSQLTPQEQHLWFQGDPAAFQGMNGFEIYEQLNSIQEKAESWMTHNLFAMQYSSIEEVARQSTNNPFSARMNQARDSIFELARKKFDVDTTEVTHLLDHYFKTNYFSKLNQNAIDSLYNSKESITDIFNPQFKYILIMPGKIISGNTPFYDDNQLTWKLNAWRFLAEDYVITAESRKLNLWAVLLTLIFIGAIIYQTVKRN